MTGAELVPVIVVLLLLSRHAIDLHLARRDQLRLDDLEGWQRRQDRRSA